MRSRLVGARRQRNRVEPRERHVIIRPLGSDARSRTGYFPHNSPAAVRLAIAEPVDLDRVEAVITEAWCGAAEPAGSH